ncbi:MAG: hypothetical protein ACRDNW_21010 [Trebonia sp.]
MRTPDAARRRAMQAFSETGRSGTSAVENWAPIRPDGTGVGKVSLWAGQQVICQSGDVEGRFTGGGRAGVSR